jgi:hypothetical protein
MALIAAAMMSCLLDGSATGALADEMISEKSGRGEVNVRREGCGSLAEELSAFSPRMTAV